MFSCFSGMLFCKINGCCLCNMLYCMSELIQYNSHDTPHGEKLTQHFQFFSLKYERKVYIYLLIYLKQQFVRLS